MKTKTTLIVGLTIGCSVAIHAQEFSLDTLGDNTQTGAAILFNPNLSAEWVAPYTSSPASSEQWIELRRILHEAVSTNASMPMDYHVIAWSNRTERSEDISSAASGYQVVILPDFQQETDDATETREAAETVTNFFNTLTGNDLIDWTPSARPSESKETLGEPGKNRVQIIAIQPMASRRDSMELPPLQAFESRPDSAWYEWLNPRIFLAEWADFWTKGTDAQPVVLVLFTF